MSEEATLDEFTEDDESNSTEWMVRSLGELAEYQNGNAFSKSEWGDKGYPIIRIQNLTGEQDDFNYFDGDLEERYEVEAGDTLLSWSATIDVFRWSGPKAALNQHIFRVDTRDEANNTFYRFKLEHLLPRLVALSHGSTMQHVRKADLVNVDAKIPPLSQQRKIATVLYTVDRVIKKTEETVEQMDIVQQGLLRCLFGKENQRKNTDIETKTERLGPKQFQVPLTWETTEISSIGKVVTGNTPSTDNESNFGGNLPFVTPETLSQGKYVTKSNRTLSEAGRNGVKPIPEKSVMMDCIGSDMGKVAVAECEVATNQQINSVVIEDESYLPEFLYYHLQFLSDFIKSQAGQTATPIVNKSSFESFGIFKPPIEEQQEIVDTLSVYDEGRKSNIEYLAGLKRLKRGLMQDLLSGTVRTTDTNIQVPDEIVQYG